LTHPTLKDLGWTNFYVQQLDLDEFGTTAPTRITAVHRKAVAGLSEDGPRDLAMPTDMSAGDIAVGDWVLAHPTDHIVIRRLDRQTVLQRGNDYHDADILPVILLTKADQADDPDSYTEKAQALGRDLSVVTLDATSDTVASDLAPWCGAGQTVAMAGSSGVGKTTIANALTGSNAETQGIREDDARGRHTTTSRSLHRIPNGGWLIDTPGMRGLGVADVSVGIAATFPEISELEDQCKFRDCKHENEPGCAVQDAITRGDVQPDRLKRYQKLQREDMIATETLAQNRQRMKKFTKKVKGAMAKKRR